jgi:biopolymer transport protein ExbB/TolQ
MWFVIVDLSMWFVIVELFMWFLIVQLGLVVYYLWRRNSSFMKRGKWSLMAASSLITQTQKGKRPALQSKPR